MIHTHTSLVFNVVSSYSLERKSFIYHRYFRDWEPLLGTALEHIIDTNNLYQIIEEPTNIRGEIIFVEYEDTHTFH